MTPEIEDALVVLMANVASQVSDMRCALEVPIDSDDSDAVDEMFRAAVELLEISLDAER